jgi:hypothetical protein
MMKKVKFKKKKNLVKGGWINIRLDQSSFRYYIGLVCKEESSFDMQKFKSISHFFIDSYIANISLYSIIRPKLNFGCCLTTFVLTFKLQNQRTLPFLDEKLTDMS